MKKGKRQLFDLFQTNPASRRARTPPPGEWHIPHAGPQAGGGRVHRPRGERQLVPVPRVRGLTPRSPFTIPAARGKERVTKISRDVYTGARGTRTSRDLGRAVNPHLAELRQFPEQGHCQSGRKGQLRASASSSSEVGARPRPVLFSGSRPELPLWRTARGPPTPGPSPGAGPARPRRGGPPPARDPGHPAPPPPRRPPGEGRARRRRPSPPSSGPRGAGPGGGACLRALRPHPPPGRWRLGNTPPAPVRRVGEAAGRTGALQRRGAGRARARARSRHPRAAPRASEAPHAQGRARAPAGRRPRVAPARADSRLLSPTPHQAPQPPPTRSRPRTPH